MSARIAITLATLFFTFAAQAKIVSKSNYKYPITDPDEATVASTAIHTPLSKTEEIRLKVKDRRIRDYRSDRYLEAKYYPSPWPTKQLVFIISGIGGDTKSGYSTFLANQTQMRGVDALVVPNVITANFIISSSATGLVGGSADDAADLYEALVKAKGALSAKGRSYDKVSLVGYSHGALLAAFLQASDERAVRSGSRSALRFDSALLINPPVDLLHAIRVIDKRTKATKNIGVKQLVRLALRFHKLIGKFTKILTTPETHVEFSKSLRLQAEERYALIGKALTVSLPSAILAGQAIDDLGILPAVEDNPASVNYRYSRQARAAAAGRYSYEDYVLNFFSAHATKTKSQPFSIDYLNQKNSLTALSDLLHSSKKIYLMHNMDDLLLTNGQGYWLDQLFGNRAVIYPTGGHLGNMWYPDNLNDYHRWLYYGRF